MSIPQTPISPTTTQPLDSGFDLLRVPLVGRFLHWRHARSAMQIPVLLVALAMIVHGLTGPQLSPKNLATVLTWVHYRGALIVILLVAGNFFCMSCPFMLPRELARRFFKPTRLWPRQLRNKWLAIVLVVTFFFCYELFDLWSSPWLTAWLIIGYFATALIVDTIFKGASFCKYVCPIGQFNFVASTLSPLEVKVRSPQICHACQTRDCIKGRHEPQNLIQITQRGCELALFQPKKVGNLDCTFCLDCVHACPHDNIGITTRLPASELEDDPHRSGIGVLSKRKDIAALSAIFTFGALLNAFGMVSPVYAVETWLARVLRVGVEAPVLGTIFFLTLVAEPILLLGAAAYLTRRASESGEKLLSITTRFVYCLVPLGFSVWLAHYTFHLLTGLLTFVPVLQYTLREWGISWLGQPQWGLGGVPVALVRPLETGFLSLGLLGSWMVAWRIAQRFDPASPRRAFMPWAALCFLLWISALWLLSQPMEMRATLLSS